MRVKMKSSISNNTGEHRKIATIDEARRNSEDVSYETGE